MISNVGPNKPVLTASGVSSNPVIAGGQALQTASGVSADPVIGQTAFQAQLKALRRLQDELTGVNKRFLDLKQTLDSDKKAVSKANSDLLNLKNDIALLKSKLDMEKEELEKLRKQRPKPKDEIRAKKEAIDNLEDEIKAKSKLVPEFSRNLTQLEAKLARTRDELQKQTEKRDDITAEITKLDKSVRSEIAPELKQFGQFLEELTRSLLKDNKTQLSAMSVNDLKALYWRMMDFNRPQGWQAMSEDKKDNLLSFIATGFIQNFRGLSNADILKVQNGSSATSPDAKKLLDLLMTR